eukprot:1848858-Pyramimonas_sp.AAC.1
MFSGDFLVRLGFGLRAGGGAARVSRGCRSRCGLGLDGRFPGVGFMGLLTGAEVVRSSEVAEVEIGWAWKACGGCVRLDLGLLTGAD